MTNRDQNQGDAPERQTYNLWPETGRILGLGKNAVYAAAARKEIPTIRVGGRLLVPRAALEQLLSCTRGGDAA